MYYLFTIEFHSGTRRPDAEKVTRKHELSGLSGFIRFNPRDIPYRIADNSIQIELSKYDKDGKLATHAMTIPMGETKSITLHDRDVLMTYYFTFSVIERKALSLLVDDRYNDRGSGSMCRNEEINVDPADISPGDPLPGWKWHGIDVEPPVVRYYDGETIEVEYQGKTFATRVGDPPAELLEASLPNGGSVYKSRVISLKCNHTALPENIPAWREIYAHTSYNVLTRAALPVLDSDPVARRWFMRLYSRVNGMYFLEPATVEFLRENAGAGSPAARFALGRYLLCAQPEDDSTRKAIGLFEQAEADGLPEAMVSLAMAWDYGETGFADRDRGRKLLHKALEAECDFAAEYQIRKVIFGLRGVEEDPEEALDILDGLIRSETSLYGAEEVNPVWHYYKGCALQTLRGWSHGLEYFQKAADMGLIGAWADIAIALSHNDEGEMTDKAAFAAASRRGMLHRNATCAYFVAINKVEDFDSMPKYSQWLAQMQLQKDLENAYAMGSSEAAEELGDLYYYGHYGVSEDNARAYRHYAQGALLNNGACYEKMYGMIHYHYIDKPQEVSDMLALYGARLDSRKMMEATVAAYSYGRLTEFASEIERYYLPVVDAEDGDDGKEETDSKAQSTRHEPGYEVDDLPDDDGRFDPYV